ncbi:MAG: D-tyrosyl-tRNA(Tyr) deacylase [Clostridiales bacterium]|nr:D-tyrosyl-tRNA(Tyr) deacylase [Clostridiales bacterium]
MRAVLTRVKSASVAIEGQVVGQIGRGYLILLGVGPGDTPAEAARLAEKIANLRIFNDENGKMNLNLATVGGEILVVSQFTLYADLRSRRPGFSHAAKPEQAVLLYERFMEELRSRGFHVEHGEFGAEMEVASVNDGPVTLLYDTDQ